VNGAQQFLVFLTTIEESKVIEILSRLKKAFYDERKITGSILNTNYRLL